MSAVTNPNFASDSLVEPPEDSWKATRHIFYTSGIRDVHDGIPKYVNSTKDFGGSGVTVEDGWHAAQRTKAKV